MRKCFVLLLMLGLGAFQTAMAQAPHAASVAPASAASPTGADNQPLLQLGTGDQVKMEVYGRPEMDTTMYVSDDGTINVPLAGAVKVRGLSPSDASRKVEVALKDGQFLVNPHVTLSVMQSVSQRVSIVGEVKVPGRYPIESSSTILDVIAQASGLTEKASDDVFVIRQDSAGASTRYPVSLRALTTGDGEAPSALLKLRSGDRIVIPVARQFYVSGAVHAPGSFRYQSGLTVLEAISRAGGIDERGSMRRIDVKRLKPDGSYTVISAKPGDVVEPDDVINVKERLF